MRALALGVRAIALASGPGGTLERAAGQAGSPEVVPQADGSLPARNAIMLGSATSGETWGIGEAGSESNPNWAIVHYTPRAGWSVEALLHAQGHPLSGFAPAQSSPAPGEITAARTGAPPGTGTDVRA